MPVTMVPYTWEMSTWSTGPRHREEHSARRDWGPRSMKLTLRDILQRVHMTIEGNASDPSPRHTASKIPAKRRFNAI